MARELSTLRLGDLLTDAGLLRLEELQEAVYIAKNQSLPVGRVLIMSGYLSEPILQCAIRVQSLIKDAILDYELALQALTIVHSEAIELDQALLRLGWSKQEGMRTNKLGELLLSAGIINTMQLDLALAQSEHSGLPLGRVLVNFSLISEQLLASALSAQLLVRDKKISREQAVQGLSAAKERAVPLEDALPELGTLKLPSRPSVRLGQLLVVAGLVEETKLMQAVEMGLVKEQPLGKMLLSLNLVSEAVLAKALEAQALVATGIDLDEAANILTTAVNKDITITHAASLLMGTQNASMTKAHAEQLPLYQFLQLSGLITKKDIEQAIRSGTDDPEIMGKMLLKAGILEDYVVEAAISCCDLIGKHVLQTEQAIMALNHCQRTRSSIYDCFDEFGWSQPIDSEPKGTATKVPQTTKRGAGTNKRQAAKEFEENKQDSAQPKQTVFSAVHRQIVERAQPKSSTSAAMEKSQIDLNDEQNSADELALPDSEQQKPSKPKKKLTDLVP